MSEERSSHSGVTKNYKQLAALRLSGKLQALGLDELAILNLYQRSILADTQTLLRSQGEGHCDVGVSRISSNLLSLIRELTDCTDELSPETISFVSLLSDIIHVAGYHGLTVDGNQICPTLAKTHSR